MQALAGGSIYGKDTFAAYKLLESFVEEIEGRGKAIASLKRQLAANEAAARLASETDGGRINALISDNLALQQHVEEIARELRDFESSFDLYDTASRALRTAWSAAHPAADPNVWPGAAKVNAWAAEEIARLRAGVGNFANHDHWSDEVGCLQWMGKRHAIEYAQWLLGPSTGPGRDGP
jgi:hypothetical protein